MPIVTPHDRPSEGREYYETVVGQRWTELPAKRRRAALFLKALWGGGVFGPRLCNSCHLRRTSGALCDEYDARSVRYAALSLKQREATVRGCADPTSLPPIAPPAVISATLQATTPPQRLRNPLYRFRYRMDLFGYTARVPRGPGRMVQSISHRISWVSARIYGLYAGIVGAR